MRLLDTTSLDIVSFLADTTPPYAILSHTWGAEHDEPTLQQLQELTAAGRLDASAWSRHPVALKKGYLKIRAACSLALSQSYRYIWVDTCCIDKTSSAELSEAINSMYRWYENAAVCYVFLEDVDVGPGIVNPDISRCRWFTRGWTLQELVAPANVYFYDYKWSYIGSKRDRADFREQLSRTTGVDGRVLTGAMPVDDLSVACRMAWAARRTTTRPEDLAYCLMGIFRVNMPLLYGEGTRAFIRLQEEILRSVDDHSLFAWAYPKGDPLSHQLSGLLASSPKYFAETSHIAPSMPDVSRESAPSSITNAGLHVQLALRPIHANSTLMQDRYLPSSASESHTDFIALLNCATTTVNKQEYCSGIRLVALGCGQFARTQSDKLLMIEAPTADANSTDSLKYVYVKQKPEWVVPEIVVEQLEAKTPNVSYGLVDVCPAGRWDKSSKTLKSGHSRQGNVLGGFRYRVTTVRKGEEVVDHLDVFIIVSQVEGQLGNWYAIDVCNRVQPGQTLQQACAEVSKLDWSDMTPRGSGLERNVSHLGLASSLERVKRGNRMSFILQLTERHVHTAELDGKEVFASGLVWSTGNLLTKRSEIDHLLALTKRMACEVTEDTIDMTFCQLLSIAERPSKIRTASQNGTSNPRKALESTLAKVLACCDDIEVLREDGGKPPLFDQYFANRLVTACIKGDLAAVTELVQTKLVNVSLESKTFRQTLPDHLGSLFLAFRPVHWAAIFGRTAIVRLLTENGADSRSKTFSDFTTVHLAAVMGHDDLLKYLVKSWSPHELVDLNRQRKGRLNDTPAHLAAAYGATGRGARLLPKLLLSSSSHTGLTNEIRNGLGETPLHRAAAMNNTEAIAILADYTNKDDGGLDCKDGYGRTPLWHAAATGAVDAVRALLGRSAKVDVPDVYGRTPLHIACREGRAAVARTLLEAGADVKRLTTAPCLSTCHFATLAADMDCLELVLEYGVEAGARHFEGLELGAIHVAAANGWLDGLTRLLDAGCDPNTPCSHLVIARGHSQMDAGVNVARLPANNVMELAIRGGHKHIVEYLKNSAR